VKLGNLPHKLIPTLEGGVNEVGRAEMAEVVPILVVLIGIEVAKLRLHCVRGQETRSGGSGEESAFQDVLPHLEVNMVPRILLIEPGRVFHKELDPEVDRC